MLITSSGAEAVNVYADNEGKTGAVQGGMQSDWYKTVKSTGKPLLAEPAQTQNGKDEGAEILTHLVKKSAETAHATEMSHASSKRRTRALRRSRKRAR